MKLTRPKHACPFTLNDVRIAGRKLLGTKVLLPAIETELRLAVSGYEHRLRSLALASLAGSKEQHSSIWRIEMSPAARLVSYVLANGKGKSVTPMSWDAIKADALWVNLRRPSGGAVKAFERPKRSEGTRWICAFDPLARAAQRMVEHIIFVVAGPSRYEHARKGRGRETAIRETLDSIEKKGVRWFGLLDVKEFFPSITREMVREVLWFLPQAIIYATIFIHDYTDIRLHSLYGDKDTTSSAFAIRKGIPQGSLVSTLVAGKVLEKHIDNVEPRHAVSIVDNVLIGGKTEEEVQAKVIALATSFEGHPSGSLRLTGEIKKLGDHTMDYLGYRFRREWRNPQKRIGRAGFSERSRRRLHTRLASKLLFANWRTWESEIDIECARWVRSFPCWSTRKFNEDNAVLEVQENLLPLVVAARAAINASKTMWSSFRDFSDFRHALSVLIGSAVPRMCTEGGPASFDRVRTENGPWAYFDALVNQNSKNLVSTVG